MRFGRDVWSSCKRVCSSQGLRPNELLEACMRAVVGAGSVRVLDGIKPSSESLEISDSVRFERASGDLARLVETAYAQLENWYEEKGELGDCVGAIDRLTNEILNIVHRIR